MSSPPRVSVVVPNYNHQRFLPERLDSIDRQSFTDFEVILLDDASTDGSLKLLQAHATKPNVRLLVNETNSGSPFHQWNRGVEEARGEYVWIAESDDTAHQELLGQLVAVLDQHPSAGLAECDSQLIDASGAIIRPMLRDAHPESAHRWHESFLSNGREEIRQFLYLQNTIPSASAVLFRREAYLAAGPADARLRLTGDWLQWVKLLLQSDRYFFAQPLSFSRVHAATQREVAASDGRSELESLSVQQRIRTLLDIDRDIIRRGAKRYATSWVQAVRAGRYRGPMWRHVLCFRQLLQGDPGIAATFAAQMPYAMGAWLVKQMQSER